MKRVFIGGMGRSGTTIALNALYRHGELTAIPIETKFLVEADGFSDLTHALTAGFSTASTPVAVRRFFNLMRNKVTGLAPSPFQHQHALSSNVFRHYEAALDDMAEVLGAQIYFEEREQALNLTRQFIAHTFDDLASISDKDGWVEKTPASIWRLGYLRELWPDCHFVHLIRDPRLIFVSLLQKRWLPADLNSALLQFTDMMHALVVHRRHLRTLPRYTEIRLEDLETLVPETLGRLAVALDLQPFSQEAVDGVAGSMTRYTESKSGVPDPVLFSQNEARIINQALMPSIIDLAYPTAFPATALLQTT